MRKIVVSLAFALAALPAWAQTQQQRDWCASPTATDDQTIEGCTALIKSGQETTNNLGDDYDSRGFAYFNKKLYDQAIADETEAIMRTPNEVQAYMNRGNDYFMKGLYDQSIVDFTKAITLKPNNGHAYTDRADAYYEKGEASLALPDAEKGVSLVPASATGLTVRGRIYETLGRRDEAISDFRAVLKLDPNNTNAKQGLIRLRVTP